MPPREIYRLDNRESPGYGAVIAGNYVEISPRLNRFRASVQAYRFDPNEKHKQFDTPEAAAAWAAETARTHKGEPDDSFEPAEQWEIMDGCSIAAHRLEEGGYESHWGPMWVNSTAEGPYNDRPEAFPTIEEAMAHGRQQAGQWIQAQRDHQQRLQSIKTALEQAPDP